MKPMAKWSTDIMRKRANTPVDMVRLEPLGSHRLVSHGIDQLELVRGASSARPRAANKRKKPLGIGRAARC
jgi:hypothetical protein